MESKQFTIVSRVEIEATSKLEEAIAKMFSVDVRERICLFPQEAMVGELATAYDQFGKEARKSTYRNLATDFLAKTGYLEKGIPRILDAGCGSGLLSLELTHRTNALVIGVDVSEDMIRLANKNKQETNPEADVFFFPESLYSLPNLTGGEPHFNYVVCRNVLHRLRNPKEVIKQMYDSLHPGGKMYLRDLKRDADWPTVVKRIGEQRWQHPELVKDYIGAMAQMLTVSELQKALAELKIGNVQITDGEYLLPHTENPGLKEYQKEVEYVCVISKG